MKTLVLYYSFEGNTEFVANELAKILNADIQKVEPVKELKSHGFSKYIWGGRQATMRKKPPIKAIEKDPKDYDLVLIGSPVWAFTYAPPIRTLLNEYSFEGKKVGYFICHEGGPGKTIKHFNDDTQGGTFLGSQEFVNPLKGDIAQIKKQVESFASNLAV